MTLEQLRRERTRAVAQTAAWLSKQVELGLAEVDLSLPQYRILTFLAEGSAISTALADRLAVRPPSVTALVDGLVGRGLIERHHAEDDRRHVSHVLTPDAKRLLAEADAAVYARLATIAHCLPEEGQAEEVLDGLCLWGPALSAHHAAKRAAP